MSEYKPIQQIVKHKADCVMLNGRNGDQPWCLPKYVSDYIGHKEVGRDLSGRKNPKAGHSWVVLRCNDTDCPAKLAIYWNHFAHVMKLNQHGKAQDEEIG